MGQSHYTSSPGFLVVNERRGILFCYVVVDAFAIGLDLGWLLFHLLSFWYISLQAPFKNCHNGSWFLGELAAPLIQSFPLLFSSERLCRETHCAYRYANN